MDRFTTGGFLHPSIITRLRRTPPPLPTHPFVGMLAFIKQGLSLEQLDNSTAVDGSTHWGAWISLSFSTLLFFTFLLPVTKWCCLGSRACFRFHCHIPTHFFSSSLFVHPHCLHLSSVSSNPPLPTYHHLRACRSLCIRRRCSLSSPSQFSRQPKPQFRHRHRHCASLKHTKPPSTLLNLAPLSTVSPSLTTTWSPKLSSLVPHIRHRSPL